MLKNFIVSGHLEGGEVHQILVLSESHSSAEFLFTQYLKDGEEVECHIDNCELLEKMMNTSTFDTDTCELGKPFLIKLTIYIGEYEKTATHLVRGNCKEQAKQRALKNECHGELVECGLSKSRVLDDGGAFGYSVASCSLVSEAHYQLLKQYI